MTSPTIIKAAGAAAKAARPRDLRSEHMWIHKEKTP